MDNTDRIPASEAEGDAYQENLNQALDNQDATINPFQPRAEHTSNDTPSSNIEDAGSHVRFEETTSDKSVEQT